MGSAVVMPLRISWVAHLEGLLFGGVGLTGSLAQVILRPQPAHLQLAAVVYGQHARIQIAQRIQVDQAGADQGVAVVNRLVHVASKVLPDKLDGVAREHHLGVSPQYLHPALVADHKGRFQAGAWAALHGPQAGLVTKAPSRATMRPPLITVRCRLRLTTASARFSAGSSSSLDWQPTPSP